MPETLLMPRPLTDGGRQGLEPDIPGSPRRPPTPASAWHGCPTPTRLVRQAGRTAVARFLHAEGEDPCRDRCRGIQARKQGRRRAERERSEGEQRALANLRVRLTPEQAQQARPAAPECPRAILIPPPRLFPRPHLARHARSSHPSSPPRVHTRCSAAQLQPRRAAGQFGPVTRVRPDPQTPPEPPRAIRPSTSRPHAGYTTYTGSTGAQEPKCDAAASGATTWHAAPCGPPAPTGPDPIAAGAA